MILSNENIRGIPFGNVEYKITQFADDTTLILDGSKSSLEAALNTLELFGSLSGLLMNSDETKLIWVGKKRYSKDKFDLKQNFAWGDTEFTLLGLKFSIDLDNIIDLNYETALNNIQKLFNAWKRHNLTPFGKIAVIKTFAISQLNHLFITLPTPNKKLLKDIESHLFNFIWDGKLDKISRKKITHTYSKGGMNMVDINNFITALKTTWIRRMYLNNDAPWVHLATHYIRSVSKLFYHGAQYAHKISKFTTKKFWSDVLTAWGNILQQMPTRQFLPENEPLWYNPNMSKVELYLPNWSRQGILSLSDIVFSNGDFLSQTQISKAFNVRTNYLEYHRVVSCAKIYLNKNKSEKKIVNFKPTLPNHISLILKSKTGSKDFYEVLRDSQNVIIANSFWTEKLQMETDAKIWQKIYNVCFKTTQDNSLRWLQYKILNNILGTKAYRFKMKLSDDPFCSFSNLFNETSIHLFATCQKVCYFWQSLQNLILRETGFTLDIDVKSILFGYLPNNKVHTPLNIIYIVAKKYIFQTSRKQKNLQIKNFQEQLYQVFTEEEYIAKLELKHDMFLKKWNPFTTFFMSCSNS